MTTASNLVLEEVDGTTLIVTINRPDVRNCVDGPTAAALADAFRRFDADPTLSVAILTGAAGAFCAGADLKAVQSQDPARSNRMEADGDAPMGVSRMRLDKPVIAAVEGHAVAGGLELAGASTAEALQGARMPTGRRHFCTCGVGGTRSANMKLPGEIRLGEGSWVFPMFFQSLWAGNVYVHAHICIRL